MSKQNLVQTQVYKLVADTDSHLYIRDVVAAINLNLCTNLAIMYQTN